MDPVNYELASTGHIAARPTLDTGTLCHADRRTSPNITSSAPPTPSLRRSPHPVSSPVSKDQPPRTPHALRRTSSSQSLNKPLPSSPQLTRKGSRQSLTGTPDGAKDRRPTPKRSISNLIAGLRESHATMDLIEEPAPLTAVEIAKNHFMEELLNHSRVDCQAETVVVLHNACYGHRYSRLKATKTTLSMIVERPERLHASVLGASTAYVRLGEHHAGGTSAPHPTHQPQLRPPFKINCSTRSMPITSSFVTTVHGSSWMSELKDMCRSAPEKLAAGLQELSREQPLGGTQRQQLHEGDLYLAPASLDAFQGALGGVADAVDAIFAQSTGTKRAFVAVRPPGHHCAAELPSGFCWLNNVHVGIEYASQTYGLTHAAILDFDLHHGDGSQAIAWQRNSKNNEKRLNAKPSSKLKLGADIGYYSLHDINSYPCESGDDEKVQAASLCIENAHGQSIWNVHLQPWKTEDEFWQIYEEQYTVLIQKAKNFLEHHDRRIHSEGKTQAKSAIFISAGFDASEWEGSGMQRHKVNVPTEFYARFTQDIVRLAQEVNSCEGRVISVLEGGYSDRALCTGVLSHLSGLCGRSVASGAGGLDELMKQMGGLAIQGTSDAKRAHYDKRWWSPTNMTALENQINPPPPAQTKKVRSGPQPTYATPTESFAYKVVDPQKFARSVSGTMREAQVPVRPPTPPPPEVDWVVATQELSRLLVPADRQTKSCTPEELAVIRTKKERHTATPILSMEQTAQPRQLRDRRTKAPTYAASAHSDETSSVRAVSRAESRSSRRETIDVLPSVAPQATSSRRLSRRLSAGSALSSMSGTVDTDPPPMPTLPSATAVSASVTQNMRPPPPPVSGPAGAHQRPRVKASSKALPTNSTVGTTSVDVDNLTSGLKKITLKVSASKEEHDRKQKEKLDAERRARALKGAETRRINAAAKKAAKETVLHPMPTGERPGLPMPASDQTASAEPHVSGAVTSVGSATADTMNQSQLHAMLQDTMGFATLRIADQAEVQSTAEYPAESPAQAYAQTNMSVPSAQRATTHPETSNQFAAPVEYVGKRDATDTKQSQNDYQTLQPRPENSDPGTGSFMVNARAVPSSLYTHVQPGMTAAPSLPPKEGSGYADPASSGKLPVWSSTGPIPFAELRESSSASQSSESRSA